MTQSKSNARAGMAVVLFHEADVWYAHCPALEITGYGTTEDEARRSFQIMLDEFFRFGLENGNLHSELSRLGWRVEQHTPPAFEALISKDPTLKDLFDTHPVKTVIEPVPAYD